ncbi:rRNA-processing protein fcf2-like [Silene latifolia]|uniref:rRNA-processing protein fcf2-like n=1 Tax=Silene latifolia TaxID=37657 RepID=UPI003D776D3C
MPEVKPMIGLTWEPKLPTFSKASSSSTKSKGNISQESSGLYMPTSELVDGLYVPPNNPRKVNIMRKKQIKDTAGKSWFDMPAPVMTPQMKQDLQLLKLRSVMDPKRHYKKSDTKLKTLPKYFQMGTVVEPASEYFSSRLTKKERKSTLAEELLNDMALTQYRKRKVREIEEHNRPGGNEKWRNRGKQTQKRAKEKRHISESKYMS